MSARQEFGLPEEAYIHPRDGTLPPVTMATATAGILDIYFKDAINDMVPATDFLQEHTVAYLNGAERGLARYAGQFARHRNLSVETLDRMFDKTSGNRSHDPDDHEAFDFSVVVFGIMPEVAEYKHLPKGFSRRGIIAPPFTADEHLERIQEMRDEVAKILVGQTTPRTIVPLNHPLWRTCLFFDVARQLPEMYRQNPRLIVDRSKEAFENLLGDIVVDIKG